MKKGQEHAVEHKTLEQLASRVFANDDGERLLRHLEALTMQRVVSPDCATSVLWHLEGQRFLVNQLRRLVDKGTKGDSLT